MKKIAKILFLTLLIASCNSDKKAENIEVDTLDKSVIEKQSIASNTVTKIFDCYMGVIKKDTISLKLIIADNAISGDLAYNFFEKDQNIGTIKGYITGDTLFAKYTFQSEGVESVRDVAFLTKNNIVREVYGEQIEKNGQSVFVNKAKLDFTKSLKLINIECNY